MNQRTKALFEKRLSPSLLGRGTRAPLDAIRPRLLLDFVPGGSGVAGGARSVWVELRGKRGGGGSRAGLGGGEPSSTGRGGTTPAALGMECDWVCLGTVGGEVRIVLGQVDLPGSAHAVGVWSSTDPFPFECATPRGFTATQEEKVQAVFQLD